MIKNFFIWAYDLILGAGAIWEWLTTPLDLIVVNIAPIYLLVGSILIIGIVRSIL